MVTPAGAPRGALAHCRPPKPAPTTRTCGRPTSSTGRRELRHVGGRFVRRLVGRAPAHSRVEVRRIPVPPVVRRGPLLVRVMVLRGLVEQFGQLGDVHGVLHALGYDREGAMTSAP